MFCWSCGHANLDNQQFCGECGRSLFKPEKVVQEISSAKSFLTREEQKPAEAVSLPSKPPVISPPVKPPAKADTTVLVPSREREIVPPQVANPLVEEPRLAHETPVAATTVNPPTSPAPPTPIRDRIPNRISGPSFLGLSDEAPSRTDEDGSYLLDDDAEPSSPWPGYLMLAVLVIGSLLVIRNWQDVRTIATDYSQRLGISDAPKHTSGPPRVTASNDASQMTPDAAQVEGNTSPSSANTSDTSKLNPTETAKLEKPQSDATPSRDESKPSADNAETSRDSANAATAASAVAAKPAPGKERTAAPAYDNAQLELAQKYLQGKGVPQDCNRGVDLLRTAARQPNPKARVQMAALYVSGHCVTPDPVQAYNWFSQAQELEPHNHLIERNLDSIWARMSDDERRKVLR